MTAARSGRRRRRAAGLLLAAVLATGCAACGGSDDSPPATTAAQRPPAQSFRSRPDLRPPLVRVTTTGGPLSPGYVFIAPKKRVAQAGPMILDDRGQLVWFDPLDTRAVADFRVQRYHGRPVLTWWRGRATGGVGDGNYVIMDSSYRQIATVVAGNGLTGDIHEFLITPRNTALITVYRRLPVDLSSVGGPVKGRIFEGIVQELDITSGRVLFEWHSYPAVALAESYAKPPPASRGAKAAPYDYFHINSIEVEPDGDFLVSARNTHALYEISRDTGRVLWRLGGKRSDFAMGPGTGFAWQHDARRQPDGTITLFDNGADPKVEDHTRVLRLKVDEAGSRVKLVRALSHPERLLAGSQGNAQFLPDGHVFVGWGAQPRFTEFDADGTVVLDGRFGSGADSYRAYRYPWVGTPATDPDLSVEARAGGRVAFFASWNGATGVARWQVLAGPNPSTLRPVTSVAKAGFETTVVTGVPGPYVAVRALDRDGAILGTSRTVARPG